MAAVALRAAAQRLRDDAADPLLPELVALVLGSRAAGIGERTIEQELVRQAPLKDLATIWTDAARHLEELAAGLKSPPTDPDRASAQVAAPASAPDRAGEGSP